MPIVQFDDALNETLEDEEAPLPANLRAAANIDTQIGTATQAALDLKAPIASPTFTGTVGGVTKSMVGLGNVDNTSDANKPISTATQAALDVRLSTFATQADFEAATIAATVLVIQVTGYAEEGDGGTHLKKRISIPSPAEAWHSQSADGAWWEVVSEIARAEFFATTRAGSDDTAALASAIEYAKRTGGCRRVELLAGAYRIDTGNLDLEHVEIAGCGIPGARYPFSTVGTVIEVVGDTNPGFLVGYGASIKDVTFYYPDQDATLIEYPPLFRSKNALGFCNFVNVSALNPWNFMHVTAVAGSFGAIHFSGCRVFSIDTDFHFERGSPEVIEFTSCTFSESVWNGDVDTTVRDAALAHAGTDGTWLKFDPDPATHQTLDGLTVDDACIVRGRRRGIDVLAGALGPCSFFGEWEVTQVYRSDDACASSPTFDFSPSWLYCGLYGGASGLTDAAFEVRGASTEGYINFSPKLVAHTVGSVLQIRGGVRSFNFAPEIVRNCGRGGAGTYYVADIDSTTVDFICEFGIADMVNTVGGNTHNGVLITNANRAKLKGTHIRGANQPYSFQGGTVSFDHISSASTGASQSMLIGASASILAGLSNLDKPTLTGMPLFVARSGTVTYSASITDIAFAFDEPFDKGGNFSSPSFTAPQAGVYEFKIQLGHDATVTAADTWLIDIVTAGGSAQKMRFYYRVAAAANGTVLCEATFSLAKGDTVKGVIQRTSGSGSFALINDAGFNSFSGRLVG
jgi:hypothetical protein